MPKKPPRKNNIVLISHDHPEFGMTKDMNQSQLMAAAATHSTLQASVTVKSNAGFDHTLETSDVMTELVKAGNEVVGGKLERLERMLVNQAISLDTLFHRFLGRANKAEYMKTLEVYMRLALKAQAQSRVTVEALSILKNPQPFISQTNIGQVGHNQVNNSYVMASSNNDILMQSEAGNAQTAPNKLLAEAEGLKVGAVN